MSDETNVEVAEDTEDGGTASKRASMEQFITAWQQSDSVQEVADKLNEICERDEDNLIEVGSVNARASKYRSPEFLLAEKRVTGKDPVFKLDAEGNKILSRPAIPLKAMAKGGGPKLDMGDAFALIAQLSGQTVDEVKAQSEALGEAKLARHSA